MCYHLVGWVCVALSISVIVVVIDIALEIICNIFIYCCCTYFCAIPTVAKVVGISCVRIHYWIV